MKKKNDRFGFVIDPIEGFTPKTEATFFLLQEAQRRGHRLFTFQLKDLHSQGGEVWGEASEIELLRTDRRPYQRVIRRFDMNLADLNALFLRKDPPVDLHFIQHLYLLQAIRGKVFMLNDPAGLLRASEKILALHFASFMPETIVTSRWGDLEAFARKQKNGIVLKPLHSGGGRAIFAFKKGDSNLKAAYEVLSHEGADYLLCQQYLPEIRKGDKRVMMLNGEVAGYFLRVPKVGEHRANLRYGGRLKKCRLTPREKRAIDAIGPVLKKMGLYFVGLDFIGGHLTEINVTSPAGILQSNLALGGKLEARVLDFVESQIHGRR